ncbi:hypothetical protein B2A_03636, partial [mine drainage metagenome]
MSAELRSASTWDELFALKGFQREQIDPQTMQQGHVVGQYDMTPATDLRPCGITNCAQPHRKGFIIELPNRTLSNVGQVCGRKKLGARWDGMLRSYKDARHRESEIVAEKNARVEAEKLMMEALSFPAALVQVDEMLTAFDTLPPRYKAEIERRAQQGDGRVFLVREPTRQEIDRAKFHGQPVPHRTQTQVATIDSIKAVAPNSRADLIARQRIPRLVNELRKMCNDPAVKASSIRAQGHIIEGRDGICSKPSIDRA